jgi:hypothetical protein
MTTKEVVIHRSAIEEWATRSTPPVELGRIKSVLSHIDKRVSEAGVDNVVMIEDEVGSDGFNALPDRVGQGNTARLMGARAGYCMREARGLLEDSGIKVKLDTKGTLE